VVAEERSFVGRSREMLRLLDGIEAAREGRGAMVLLAGEPGIGKTRIAQELAKVATASGVHAHWARCWDAGAPPFWPWCQALRSIELPGQRVAHGPVGSLLKAVASVSVEIGQDRIALFDSVAELLDQACQSATRLLVLDDLHWADAPSLALLRYVARQVVGHTRLLVLGTYRDADARLASHAGVPLAQAAREGRTIVLGGLDGDALAELAHADHPRAPLEIVESLHASTGGNPLFAHEVLALAVARGGSRIDVGALSGVRSVLHERLAFLTPSAQRALFAAAVLGREFDPHLVSMLCPDSANTVEALDAARNTGLLRAVVTGSAGRLEFAHDLVREACYGELTADERREMHARAASALEPTADAWPAEYARHVFAALRDEDVDRAGQAALRAGRCALDELAFEEAADWFARAAAILNRAGPGSSAVALEATVLLGEAQLRSGDLAAGTQTCRRAIDQAETLGRADLLSRAAIAYGLAAPIGRVDGFLVAALERSLALLGEDDRKLRALLKARLSGAMMPHADPSVPLVLAREAIREARATGDRATIARVLGTARRTFFSVNDAQERMAIDRETAALAVSLGDRALASTALRRLADAHMELGEVEAGHSVDDERARVYPVSARPHAELDATLRTVGLNVLAGRFADADQRLARCDALAASLRERVAHVYPFDPIRLLRLLRACTQGARAPLEAALSDLDGFPQVVRPRAAAALLAHLGRMDEARIEYERALAGGLSESVDLLVRALFPEVCAALGDLTRAERFLELLSPAHGRLIYWSPLGTSWGATARLEAVLLDALGRLDEAATCFGEAIDLEMKADAAPFLARSRAGLARVQRRRGRANDAAQAEQLESEARSAFVRMGMELDLERACARRQPVSLMKPDDAPPTLRREGEVWTVDFRGTALRFADSDGLRYIDHLLARPGVSVHATELLGLSRRADVGAANAANEPGGAPVGPPLLPPLARLDQRAKDAYRQRIADLREMLEEAKRTGDLGRAEATRKELDFLTRELAGAVGLDGRDRPLGGDVERARVNVTLRIRKAIKKLGAHAPALGRYLSSNVRTGTLCEFCAPRSSGD